MNKFLTILLLTIIASLFIGCGGSSSGDDDLGSYYAVVKINNVAESNITVNLGTEYSGVTDSNGIVHIFSIEPGTYNITITRNEQTIETGEKAKISAGKKTSDLLNITI